MDLERGRWFQVVLKDKQANICIHARLTSMMRVK